MDGIRVAIVGGGIAGLTTAAALAARGIGCQIFEQTSHLGEIGAGIQLSPNGLLPLHRLGIGKKLRRLATLPTAIEVLDGHHGAMLARTVLGAECEQTYGAPYLTVHRADLHTCLASLVPTSSVHLDKYCVGIEQTPDGARIRFGDGTVAEADLVIGADGIRSAVRSTLSPDRPRYSGHTIYRGLVPAERAPYLSAHPAVRIWVGPGRHCVSYPVRGGTLVSFAASAPSTDWGLESWSAPADRDELLGAYQGWNVRLLALLGAADRITRWALYDRPVESRWSAGRVVLVGDAAHPMLPFGAQGASQAIEDAATLAACLDGAPDVPTALADYQHLRIPRVRRVHRFIAANESDHHTEDRDAAKQAADNRWRLAERAWLFGYDVDDAMYEGVAR